MLIDTHSHIYLTEFDNDRDAVLENAKLNKINQILLPNIDSQTIESMMSMANSYPDICFPMMGLHPTHVKENYKDEIKIVQQWLEKEIFYGIGETGIDLYWDKTFINEQFNSFKIQIDFAIEYNLPIVIHVRNSFNEVFNIMDKKNNENLNGVFHCFTGTLDQAKKIIDYGFKLGIGGVLTFKNSNLDETIKEIDLKNIILETDSPYLAPVPFRGKRNESAYIKQIAEKLAKVKGVSVEEIAEITTQNAKQLFKL